MNQRRVTAPPLAMALQILSDQPELLCLDGGPNGWAYVALPQAARWLHSLADLPEPDQGHADTSPYGWPGAISGGWMVQCDYGLPVGADAAAVRHRGAAGRAARLDAWLAWDPSGQAWLAGEAAAAAYLWDLLQRPAPPQLPPFPAVRPQPLWTAEEHQAKVEQVRAAIAAGVCFQANLAVPFFAPWPDAAQDLNLFLALRRASPAPYATFWRQPSDAQVSGRSICSHSPECYLQGDGAYLRSEPIKGTRARVVADDGQSITELLASAKDRAELAMIVDLVRNDLGRIAAVGSVRVEDAAKVLSLDYVHHTLAIVSARPRADTGLRDWLAASFPPGSITGAPKIEVMGLLQSLEGVDRGPYCGCFGWLGQRSCALAVAIRTMYITDGAVHFSAGGGIVADSQATAEWQEVLAKAQRMTDALMADRP